MQRLPGGVTSETAVIRYAGFPESLLPGVCSSLVSLTLPPRRFAVVPPVSCFRAHPL